MPQLKDKNTTTLIIIQLDWNKKKTTASFNALCISIIFLAHAGKEKEDFKASCDSCPLLKKF